MELADAVAAMDTDAIRAAVEPVRYRYILGTQIEDDRAVAIIALTREVDRLRADAALGAAVRALPRMAAFRHCTPCSDDVEWWHVAVDDAGAVGGVRYYGATTPGHAMRKWIESPHAQLESLKRENARLMKLTALLEQAGHEVAEEARALRTASTARPWQEFE
jgi:hypothetical protein